VALPRDYLPWPRICEIPYFKLASNDKEVKKELFLL